MNVPVITIDGPSGSGKGTVSRLVAQQLKWHLLDSGALYRLVALAGSWRGIAPDDRQGHAYVATHLAVSFGSEEADEERIWLEGQEVSNQIRTETAGEGASRVAAMPEVRAALVERQRSFAQEPGLVADGRDMGSVIFPLAQLKIYLTATAEERARRRHKQLKDKGVDVSLAALSQEIAERDRRDSTRPIAPLKPADDAIIVDSTALSVAEVVERILALAKERSLD